MSSLLRNKMTEDMRLRGLAERTREQYLLCVKRFAYHYGRSPRLLDVEDIRNFLLFLVDKGLAAASLVVYWSALHFLYCETLGRPEVFETIPRPRVPKRPSRTALTPQELRALLDAANPFDRAFFTTMYAAGLRISEAAGLCAGDIDARAGLIHIRSGKGDKARSVQLSERLLVHLREHWAREALPGPFLFPARLTGRGRVSRWADRPVSTSTMGIHFDQIRSRARLRRHVTTHDLRRAYASHLLYRGVDLRVIQAVLGHASPGTTAVYTHVSPALIHQCPCPLEVLELS